MDKSDMVLVITVLGVFGLLFLAFIMSVRPRTVVVERTEKGWIIVEK